MQGQGQVRGRGRAVALRPERASLLARAMGQAPELARAREGEKGLALLQGPGREQELGPAQGRAQGQGQGWGQGRGRVWG